MGLHKHPNTSKSVVQPFERPGMSNLETPYPSLRASCTNTDNCARLTTPSGGWGVLKVAWCFLVARPWPFQGWGAPFIDDVASKAKSRSWYRLADGSFEEVARSEEIRHGGYLFYRSDVSGSGATIAGEKSEFLKDGLKIVAFLCESNDRTPDVVYVRNPTVYICVAGPCGPRWGAY